MQTPWRSWPVVLLVAVAAGSLETAAWAQLTNRATVHGRQRVRAALAEAVADGNLTRAEEDSIYRQAKRLLTPEELPELQRTFARLAGRQQTLPPPKPVPPPEPLAEPTAVVPSASPQPAPDEPADPQDPAQTTSDQAAPGDADNPTQSTSFEEPLEASQPTTDDDLGNPFHEETAPEGTDLMADAAVIFEDCSCTLLTQMRSLSIGASRNVSFYTGVDAFKGPLDLDNRNGNFGLNLALNASIPLLSRMGVGMQAGTSAVLTDFYGTQFTGSTIRSQNFTTVGVFQNVSFRSGNLKWGCAYDWLYDEYYTAFAMGQWRAKLGYELDACREIGIWACIPDRGDTAVLDNTDVVPVVDWFKPVSQGSLYYRRCWESGTSTTGWIGLAEEPGHLVLGADARIPLTCRLALVGNLNYILPSASAEAGQDEEMWNVSLGIELTPRWGATHCQNTAWYAPLFPLANNGTFAIRRF